MNQLRKNFERVRAKLDQIIQENQKATNQQRQMQLLEEKIAKLEGDNKALKGKL